MAGIDEVEAEQVEIVDFLKQPDNYQRLGGSILKGALGLIWAIGTYAIVFGILSLPRLSAALAPA